MKETLFVETIDGSKSYYDLDVISKSADKTEVVIKHWNGEKVLKLDEKKNCYISKD